MWGMPDGSGTSDCRADSNDICGKGLGQPGGWTSKCVQAVEAHSGITKNDQGLPQGAYVQSDMMVYHNACKSKESGKCEGPKQYCSKLCHDIFHPVTPFTSLGPHPGTEGCNTMDCPPYKKCLSGCTKNWDNGMQPIYDKFSACVAKNGPPQIPMRPWGMLAQKEAVEVKPHNHAEVEEVDVGSFLQVKEEIGKGGPPGKPATKQCKANCNDLCKNGLGRTGVSNTCTRSCAAHTGITKDDHGKDQGAYIQKVMLYYHDYGVCEKGKMNKMGCKTPPQYCSDLCHQMFHPVSPYTTLGAHPGTENCKSKDCPPWKECKKDCIDNWTDGMQPVFDEFSDCVDQYGRPYVPGAPGGAKPKGMALLAQESVEEIDSGSFMQQSTEL